MLMIKEAIQKEIKLNSDEIKHQDVSSDGKYIVFIRGKHELVILKETENCHYEQNSSFNDLFELKQARIQFIGNHLCWWNIENSELKLIFIDMNSMIQSMHSQNVTEECFLFHGCLYQIIEGNIVVTDFMNESKIQVFQRNYSQASSGCLIPNFNEPYFVIRDKYFNKNRKVFLESIPIQDNALVWTLDGRFYMSSHHIITYQRQKIISQRKTALYNAKTFYIIRIIGSVIIKIYQQLMIVYSGGKLMTISRNQNQKILRNRRIQNEKRVDFGDNYHYVQLYEHKQEMDTYVFSTLDLRTFQIENYEEGKQLFIRQKKIIQFKSDTLLIHIMNS